MIRIKATIVSVALAAAPAAAQTADGATFVTAMDRSYDFVLSGDLAAFDDWTVAPNGPAACADCAPERFKVQPPGAGGPIECFVMTAEAEDDFRLCHYVRTDPITVTSRESPIYGADGALADRWMDMHPSLQLLPEGAAMGRGALAWFDCPIEGRVSGILLSAYGAGTGELFPGLFEAVSGVGDGWAASFPFPDCELLLS